MTLKWKNFSEYILWREEQTFSMNHDDAVKWVFSALGIMDNVNPKDKGQEEQITNALSSPLSSYPDKLESLAQQMQIKNAPNLPEIQAALAEPDKTTVSKLVSLLTSGNTDNPRSEDNEYQEPF